MKTKFLGLLFAMCGIMFVSCNDDDDDIRLNNDAVRTSFESKYPSADRVSWERKGGYYVAEFALNNKEANAWLDEQGVWYMTETDLRYDDLPQAIKTAFTASEYGDWRVDDVDMIERPDRETMYVLEVEKGNQEYDLYYSEEGILIKAVIDTDDNDDPEGYLPSALSEKIQSFLQTKYPQARIIETERDKGFIEVDLIEGKTHLEVVFTTDGEWTYTKTEINRNAVPQNIMNALNASEYGSYSIDDIYLIDTPASSYYYFELESGSTEVDLKITEEGNIEVVKTEKD